MFNFQSYSVYVYFVQQHMPTLSLKPLLSWLPASSVEFPRLKTMLNAAKLSQNHSSSLHLSSKWETAWTTRSWLLCQIPDPPPAFFFFSSCYYVPPSCDQENRDLSPSKIFKDWTKYLIQCSAFPPKHLKSLSIIQARYIHVVPFPLL